MWFVRIVNVPIPILVEYCHRVIYLFHTNTSDIHRSDVVSQALVKQRIFIKRTFPHGPGARVLVGRVENGPQENPAGQSSTGKNTGVSTLLKNN